MFADRTNWNLAPNPLSEALAKHLADGKRLYDLSASNPTECGLEYDMDGMLEALSNPAALTYAPDPKGLLKARQAVVDYYAARGDKISADDIVLTTSTSEAYSFVFRLLCNPGDELLVPAPSYPLFGFLAEINDVVLVSYPLLYDNGWQIDFHTLQEKISPRTSGIIVVNPNNPTGHFVSPEELKQLNEICLPRNMAIIADEVFLDFQHCESIPARENGKAGRARPSVPAKAGKLRRKRRRVDVYDERIVEDFGATADESGVAGHQRTGGSESSGARAAGSDRRHIPVHECAGATGASGVFAATAGITETTGRECGATWRNWTANCETRRRARG